MPLCLFHPETPPVLPLDYGLILFPELFTISLYRNFPIAARGLSRIQNQPVFFGGSFMSASFCKKVPHVLFILMLFLFVPVQGTPVKAVESQDSPNIPQVLVSALPSEQKENSMSIQVSEGIFPSESGKDALSPVLLGDEQFDLYLPLLEGKRTALFSNHSGIVGDTLIGIDTIAPAEDPTLRPFGQDADGNPLTFGPHILDALLEHGVNVTAIFSPEHGFRGNADAGASVGSSVDPSTGVPILSLYDKGTNAPSQKDMDTFDVLVIDIQDVGLRYYTYYISMYYLMDACAQAGKPVILLDRPNPNGFYVDGPILEDAFRSGVGALPVPIVHGMTLGELALMINGEGWLKSGRNACHLTVIPCQGYSHSMKLPLILPPSPNLKTMRSVYLYASTCFFENTVVSLGRGTDYPFEIYGSPLLENVPGFDYAFTPVSVDGAVSPPFERVLCFGRELRTIPIESIFDAGINLSYLVDTYTAIHKVDPSVFYFGVPDSKGRYWIDKLCGTDRVRLMIENGQSAEEIKASWQEDIERFTEMRRPYLLYAEE